MTAFETAFALLKGDMFSPNIPRKVDAEAIIQAKERPNSISRLTQLPKPEQLLEMPEFESHDYSDEGRWKSNMQRRNWLAEQDRPVFNYPIKPPRGSLWWDDLIFPSDSDMWELTSYEDIPLHSENTRWDEGITEDTVGAWSWEPKLAQAQKYADFYRQGYRPPPIRSLINLNGDGWRHSVYDGHHRGMMADLLGLDSLRSRVGLSAKTNKGYTRPITPKDLEMFYELAGDVI